jgi:hypothetical protein
MRLPLLLLIAVLLVACSAGPAVEPRSSSLSTGTGFISAAPNPVAAGNEPGLTTIEWDTGDGSEGQVYVSDNSGPERLFAQGTKGSQAAGWIGSHHSYEFRLYAGTARSTLLRVVTVTRGYPPDAESALGFSVTPVADVLLDSSGATGLIVVLAALLGPVLFCAALITRRRRARTSAALRAILVALVTIASLSAVLGSPLRPLRDQPFPDAQEYADGAYQLAQGNGYVTYVHDNQPQPPRYPPGFSLVLMPFAAVGEYPANVQVGSKLLAACYLLASVGVSSILGGPLAGVVAAIAIGTSPFVTTSGSLVMSDAFAAGLAVLLVGLVHRLSTARVVIAGMLAGVLVLVRFNALFALAACGVAIPRRFWVRLLIGSLPLLFALGVYQWSTFGSPLRTGYDYWVPQLKTFDVGFAFRPNPQGDGPYIVADRFDGALMHEFCNCPALHPQGALPNVVFYPAVLFGLFWIFAPPLVGLLGLAYAWSHRQEPAFSIVVWSTLIGLLVQVLYFYQGARLIAVPATLLTIGGSVALGQWLDRGVDRYSVRAKGGGLRRATPAGATLPLLG